MKSIEYWDLITREAIRDNRDKWFVFGDNAARTGRGGLARETRGELNTIGLRTKYFPTNDNSAFFYDSDPLAWVYVAEDLGEISKTLHQHDLVLPSRAIGSGLAALPMNAPMLYNHIVQFFHMISPDCPWKRII